jgi:hypothetical protein
MRVIDTYPRRLEGISVGIALEYDRSISCLSFESRLGSRPEYGSLCSYVGKESPPESDVRLLRETNPKEGANRAAFSIPTTLSWRWVQAGPGAGTFTGKRRLALFSHTRGVMSRTGTPLLSIYNALQAAEDCLSTSKRRDLTRGVVGD